MQQRVCTCYTAGYHTAPPQHEVRAAAHFTTAASAAQHVAGARCPPMHRLEMYNARNLDAFMDLMADDVHVSDGETGAIIATSKEQLRPR